MSLILLGGAFGLYEVEIASGATLAEARTVVTNVFVAVETFYLLSCRSLVRSPVAVGLAGNRWTWLGIVTMALLQIVLTYASPMNRVFGTAPIGAAAWAEILGVAIAAFAAVELEKALRRRARRPRPGTAARPVPVP